MSEQLRSIEALTVQCRQLYLDRTEAAHRSLGFVERRGPDPRCAVWAPKRPSKVEGVAVPDAEFWLKHCADLSGRMSDFDTETRRGYAIACRLLGLDWASTQRAVGAAYTSGAAPAAAVWAGYMSPPDKRFIGVVYVARHEADRDIRKVGFTTNLRRRMKSLSREAGDRVVAVASRPGTMLNEWALHMDLGRPVTPEWYPVDAIPEWLSTDQAGVS